MLIPTPLLTPLRFWPLLPVHFLFLLDFAQTVMAMIDAFRWFVFNFGNYETLLHSGLSGTDAAVVDGLIAMTVQIVYSWRIWMLSKWRALPVAIALVCQHLYDE